MAKHNTGSSNHTEYLARRTQEINRGNQITSELMTRISDGMTEDSLRVLKQVLAIIPQLYPNANTDDSQKFGPELK